MDLCIAHGGDLSVASGGTDRVTAVASGLVERGQEVVLVTPRTDGALPEELRAVDHVTVPLRRRGILDQPVRGALVAHRARALADERGGELLVVHSTLGGVTSLVSRSGFLLDMHDCAYASPLYGDLPLGRGVQRAIKGIEGRAVRHADHVFVVSERMQTLLAEEWGVGPERTTVVPNGYFHDRVAPFREVDAVARRVVFLGTLHPKVDIDALVEIALSEAVEELFVIGDGPRRSALVAAGEHADAEALQVTGRLPTDRAMELAASASLAIAPQRPSRTVTASSPVKLYTYAALGLPIVATDGPEYADELAARGKAALVPPEGPFAETVTETIEDDATLASMAESAREIGEEARWSRRVERVAEYLDGLDRG